MCTHAGTDNDDSKSDGLSSQKFADTVNGNRDAIKHTGTCYHKVLLGYSYHVNY